MERQQRDAKKRELELTEELKAREHEAQVQHITMKNLEQKHADEIKKISENLVGRKPTLWSPH